MREFFRGLDRLIDRFPPWPNERQWVSMALFALAAAMLLMARENPKLWDVKLFEVTFQAIMLTGILNMIVAFHFAANKGEREANVKRAENVGKAFDAVRAAAVAAGNDDPTRPDVTIAPGESKTITGTETDE